MKLILMRGLPASGKSSHAKKLLEEHPGQYKRVNRDLLREMLNNGKFSKANEKFVVAAEMAIAKMALVSGLSVIVDDCNLSQTLEDKWNEFACGLGVKFEIVDFRDVSVTECIKRDQKRQNYVGEKVIKRMYNQHILKPPANVDTSNLPSCWVFDLDGCLALHNSRSPYETERCEEDVVNESVRAILNRIEDNIFLMSGRSDKFREHTKRWLEDKAINYTYLYMRKEGDLRSDDIVKREMYENYIHGKYKVMGWFDDRLKVCRTIHNLGLPLYRVGDPEADF